LTRGRATFFAYRLFVSAALAWIGVLARRPRLRRRWGVSACNETKETSTKLVWHPFGVQRENDQQVVCGGPSMKTFIVTLSALVLVLAPATTVRANDKEKAGADAEFLSKVIPGIAASIKIIDYAVKNSSDAKVKDFAERVAKQHKGSIKTATEHARRLGIAVVADPDKDSKEMLDKLSKLSGTDVDIAFLKWLSDIHENTTVFDNEVKNGVDADLKDYAKNSIISGNEHLKEARELLAKMKK
jgi:putative membrane protein